jgi:small conductance mechanosensitive channel
MSFQKILETLASLGATWGLKVLGVLITLWVSFRIAGWIRSKIAGGLERRKFDPTLSRFFANMARYGIIVGAVLGCMGVFGIQTASFAAVIASMGLAIGLAFQGSLSNFAAGVMLLVFRPYRTGDFIIAGGKAGVVEELELFSTKINTPDNRHIVIPNSKIFGDVIENVSYNEKRRVDVDVGVEYKANIDKTRAILEEAVGSVAGVLAEPAPQVFLKALGASSVDWQLRAWCKTPDYWAVYEAIIRAAKQGLETAGIGIPFPQLDVHFDSAPLPGTWQPGRREEPASTGAGKGSLLSQAR